MSCLVITAHSAAMEKHMGETTVVCLALLQTAGVAVAAAFRARPRAIGRVKVALADTGVLVAPMNVFTVRARAGPPPTDVLRL